MNNRAGEYIDVCNVKLFYEIHGEGYPLLLLHGGLESIEGFRNVIPDLSKHFKVIAVDRRGHGRSYDDDRPYEYEILAAEMNEFLGLLKIDKAHIIGFSDGGNIGFHIASKYPQLVDKFVAVSPNHLVKGGMHDEVIELIKIWNMEYFAKNNPFPLNVYNELSPTPDFENYLLKAKKMWLKDPTIAKEELQGIDLPVLFIAGDRDMIRLEHMIDMYNLVKDSQLAIFPETTHLVIREQPDLFSNLAVHFLNTSH